MKAKSFIIRLFGCIVAFSMFHTAAAGSPVWTLAPLTATTVSVPANGTSTIQYQVTNQSNRVHTLSMQAIPGITQLIPGATEFTNGIGVCGNPFVLTGKSSCVLLLQVNGSLLTSPIHGGPIVCEQGSSMQCYRPATNDILHLTQAPPITDATISVINSPLTLTTNGSTGTLTIHNTSLLVAATNITSNFTGTALDGNVTETGNTCANVAPQASCTLTYTPGNTAVPQTNFTIQGSNTNAVTAAIQINVGVILNTVNPSTGPASGGTGVTLTGSGFTGATNVTFGGVAATSVNVINSTTITAVTPAHPAGAVDMTITTPSSSGTKTNGFTYLTTTVGQAAYGGVIACLNGGLNNLIAATADNSTSIEWGGFGTDTFATSTTDGATNTATIVTILGNNGGTPYGAKLCSDYAVDSQGNMPCQAGNTCYNDWFLPASHNLGASGQQHCLYTNQGAIGGFAGALYWSSTESATFNSWTETFNSGAQNTVNKNNALHVRCVRAFTP